MFANLILNKKLKVKWDIKDPSIRREIGEFTGWVGIGLNLFMAVSKIFIGFLISSIAVMADGVNNSFDTASSIATIIDIVLLENQLIRNIHMDMAELNIYNRSCCFDFL